MLWLWLSSAFAQNVLTLDGADDYAAIDAVDPGGIHH